MSTGFHTLHRTVEIAGIGLHCGQEVTATLKPRIEPGIFFYRKDLPGHPAIPASISCVAQTVHATTLRNGEAVVSTTEHLLAALWSMDVTHCAVELDGPEVPILDGSSLPWVEAVKSAGLRPLEGKRAIYRISQPVWWEEAGASVLGLPYPGFRVSVAVDFGHPDAGPQTADLEVNSESFCGQLAPARTFTLEAWLPRLRAAGLIKGGSEDNAVVLWDSGPSSPWRMQAEIAKHKALDLIGDLALGFAGQGAALEGHIVAVRGGHGPHRLWLEKCVSAGALELTLR